MAKIMETFERKNSQKGGGEFINLLEYPSPAPPPPPRQKNRHMAISPEPRVVS